MKRLLCSPYVIALLALSPLGFRTTTFLRPPAEPVNAEMALAGKGLFLHEWTPHDPLANGGDGLGPVFNAKSCVACHKQGGVGGGGPLETNVTNFATRTSRRTDGIPRKPQQGVVHMQAVSSEFQETLASVHGALPAVLIHPERTMVEIPVPCGTPVTGPPVKVPTMSFAGLEKLIMPPGVNVSQRKTPALFGAKLIDDIPDRVIIAQARQQRVKWGLAPAGTEEFPVGRVSRLSNGRVGRFGWKAQTASLADFVQAACANELGLGNPGQAQPVSLTKLDYTPPGLDLTTEQCAQLTAFIGSLPRPVERLPEQSDAAKLAQEGHRLFSTTGCADCHTPDIDNVRGIYSDLLLHRMGETLQARGSYNGPEPEEPEFPDDEPLPSEWRTPPLWGLASSSPYLHDGRADTIQKAIELHAGQGLRSAGAFQKLAEFEKQALLAFLMTLQAP